MCLRINSLRFQFVHDPFPPAILAGGIAVVLEIRQVACLDSVPVPVLFLDMVAAALGAFVMLCRIVLGEVVGDKDEVFSTIEHSLTTSTPKDV